MDNSFIIKNYFHSCWFGLIFAIFFVIASINIPAQWISTRIGSFIKKNIIHVEENIGTGLASTGLIGCVLVVGCILVLG